ncbi:MAG: AI-2E family transporter [Anaerolineales bacterium]|nr:AI-2E family transporter [Anaerolineales bacterium]
MTNQKPLSESPKWGSTTKMVIGLTIVAIIIAMIIQFRQIIGPLLLAFILSFLLHPIAGWISRTTKLSWRTSVNLVYLVLIIILAAVFTATGYAIIQQSQSLVTFVDRFITDLPGLIADLSTRTFAFGPFTLDLSSWDLETLVRQFLDIVQPLVGRAGSLVSTLATSAATTAGWGMFLMLVSYFMLAESGQVPERLPHIEIPGYNSDARRLTRELARTWDAFLRGQLVISLLVILAYTVLLTILGLRFTLAIALMAGVARFVPWIGPFLTWTVTALVALLQGGNYFGLEPFKYTLLVVIACLLLDQVFDNLVVPRLLGRTLGVHPAGVLIAAIVATNMIGIVGLVLAAPVLATLNLASKYIFRKMFDIDPWPEPEKEPPPVELPWARLARRIKAWQRIVRRR